jgi:hypothetical protein
MATIKKKQGGRPAILHDPVLIQIGFERSVLNELRSFAKEEERSINWVVRLAVNEWLAKRPAPGKKPKAPRVASVLAD